MDTINYYSLPGMKYKPNIKKITDPGKIIEIICHYVGLPVEKVLGKTRFQYLVVPRHAIMYFLYSYTNMNKSEIGRKLNFDHTTIIHAITAFQNRIDTEESIQKLVNDIKDKIYLTT